MDDLAQLGGAAIGGVLGGAPGAAIGAAAGPALAHGARHVAGAAMKGVDKYLPKKVDKALDDVGGFIGGIANEWKKDWENPREIERGKKTAAALRELKAIKNWDSLKHQALKNVIDKGFEKGVPLVDDGIRAIGRGVRDLAGRWAKSKSKSPAPKPRSRSRSSRSRSRSARRRARKYADFWKPRGRSRSRGRRHRKRSKTPRSSRSRSRHRRHKALRAFRRAVKDKQTERFMRDLAVGKKREGYKKSQYSKTNHWGVHGKEVWVPKYDRYGNKQGVVRRYKYDPGRRYAARDPYHHRERAAIEGLARDQDGLKRTVADLVDALKKTGKL